MLEGTMPVTVGSRAGQVVDLIELYRPLAVRHNKVHRGGEMRERHFASQREQDASRNGPRVARARPRHGRTMTASGHQYAYVTWALSGCFTLSSGRKTNRPRKPESCQKPTIMIRLLPAPCRSSFELNRQASGTSHKKPA